MAVSGYEQGCEIVARRNSVYVRAIVGCSLACRGNAPCMKQSAERLMETVLEALARVEFACTRSFTHPYLAERVDGLWVTRDAPRRSGGRYRNGRSGSPKGCRRKKVVKTVIGRHSRHRYTICAVCGAGESRRTAASRISGAQLPPGEQPCRSWCIACGEYLDLRAADRDRAGDGR